MELTEMELRDQVALVTGASRGLGRAIALRLAREGAAVAINYQQRKAEAESLAEEIRSAGGRATAVQADVAETGRVREMAAQIEEQLGPVSILVNNAGLFRQGDLGTSTSARWTACAAPTWTAWCTSPARSWRACGSGATGAS